MTSRAFLLVLLTVVVAVTGAFGYRLLKEGQCCEAAAPTADLGSQDALLARDRSAEPLPSSRPIAAAN